MSRSSATRQYKKSIKRELKGKPMNEHIKALKERLATLERDYDACKRHILKLNKDGEEAMISGQRLQGAMTVVNQLIEEAQEAEVVAAGVATEPAESEAVLPETTVQ